MSTLCSVLRLELFFNYLMDADLLREFPDQNKSRIGGEVPAVEIYLRGNCDVPEALIGQGK